MPLDDSQLAGLLQLLIAYEKDTMVLKAHVVALETIAVRLGGDDVKRQLVQEQQALLESTNFDDSLARIRAIEQLLVKFLPTSDAKN